MVMTVIVIVVLTMIRIRVMGKLCGKATVNESDDEWW